MDTFYNGEDIDINFVLWEDDTKTNKISIDSLVELYVYCYTNGNYVVKFSMNVAIDNFIQMIRIDEFTYRCSIPSASSNKLSPGLVVVEANAITGTNTADAKKNLISKCAGFIILPAKIAETSCL